MQTIIYTEYGSPDVLKLTETEKPVPQDDEVLVKIHATGLNYADTVLLSGKPFLIRLESGLSNPGTKTPGADIAGVVEAVGNNVSRFKIGDAVFGDISGVGFGGLAEYVAVPETLLAHKPENVSFEEAAATPMAAVTALQGIRNTGEIKAGQNVLIYGASGGVGTFALQIAKSYNTTVTAVCSTGKVDMVKSIGADHVIDYKKEDFTQNGKRYDLIAAVNGFRPLSDYKNALSENGTYVVIGGSLRQIFAGMLLGSLMTINSTKKLKSMGVAKPDADDLTFIAELIDAGKIKPVVDRCYPLEDTAEAFRYVTNGHAKGKVIISIA